MHKRLDVKLRTIADEALLVPTGALVFNLNGLVTLNPTGRWIWEHLDESTTVEQLTTGLVAEYDVEVDDARRDVVDFLAELERLGVLEA